ncbi:MAG TPA: CAP domain-containing protein [Zeimonas sp.]|nr:CAP domain-containing protein [Zeimonas sp.]
MPSTGSIHRIVRATISDASGGSGLPQAALVAALIGLLAACGGGGGEQAGSTATLATASAPPAPGTSTPTTTAATPAARVDAQAALERLNVARAVPRTCGGAELLPAVAPLRWNSQLEQAAIGHSEWMQANDTFDHTGADGSSVGTRVTAAGYAWKMVGENIAAGQPDLDSVIAAWLASPGHCRNIMHPDFVDTALALKPGTSSNTYRTWWTLVFGRPS